MSSDKTFHMVVFGLSEHELRVLRTISILSKSRSRTYVLDNAAASGGADFAVVDNDDPQALAYWYDLFFSMWCSPVWMATRYAGRSKATRRPKARQ